MLKTRLQIKNRKPLIIEKSLAFSRVAIQYNQRFFVFN